MAAASQELSERAKLLISERKYQEAVRACRRALLSQPDQVEVRLLLGEALLALERYDEVRVEMMALARKLPNRVAVHRLLGEAYLRDGRPTQAVEALRRALAIDPHDAAARELLMEADDETAPISSTIERWFADEAAPTIETESPPWEEEKTPVPATSPAMGPPSVEIDPSLTAEAQPLAPQPTKVQGPRVRSRQPTLAGHAGVDPGLLAPAIAPPRVAPVPSPQIAVPRPFAGAPTAPSGGFLGPEATAAHRPSAKSGPHSAAPQTDELELDSVSEEPIAADELQPIDAVPEELSGAPTRAHVPVPSFDDDDPATYVRPPGASPVVAPPPAPAYPARHSAPPPRPFPAPRAPAGGLADPPVMAAPASAPGPSAPAPSAPAPSAPAPSAPAPSAPAPSAPTSAQRFEPTLRPPAPRAASDSETDRMRGRGLGRLILPAAIGGVVFIALCIGVGFGISAWRSASVREAIRGAARAAGDSGARADIEAALAQIEAEGTDDPELAALGARLLATLALEHDQDRRAAAEQLLARTGGEPLADTRIAAALLDLERSDASSALQRLSGLTAEGEQIAEAFRARALATAALGRFHEAEESARQAATLRPSTPRHTALHALMRHRAGDSTGALATLDVLPGGENVAAVRIARARILDESGTDPARAQVEAGAVVGELAELATPHELAWAHLVTAKHAALRGDLTAAATAARAAAQHVPPADEPFGLLLVDILLRVGDPQAAGEQLARLPEPAVDAPTRALLSAEVAIASGDLDAADAALRTAAAGPRRSLLMAQVLEARGQLETAQPLYEEAMRAAGPESRRARIRLAALALRARQAERAISLLEPAREAAPSDREVVPLLVRAYLAKGRRERAEQAIDAALEREPAAPELLAARGALELSRGRFSEALTALRAAVEARPDDPELQAELGEAARLAGEPDAARAAYEAALARRENYPPALIGLGHLALSGGDLAEAEQRLEAAAAAGGDALAVARLRGDLLVARGDGALGVAVMERLARELDDASIWNALGDLQAQAEEDRDAARSYSRARRRGSDDTAAWLGESLIAVRRGDLRGARRAIDAAAEPAESHGPEIRARLAVARGRLEFESGDFDSVVRLANEALALDARSAAPHLLLANVAIERGESPIEHFRRAVAGHSPAPEALGRLASRLGRGEEACRLATRYLQVAPRGYDAGDARDVVRGCR